MSGLSNKPETQTEARLPCEITRDLMSFFIFQVNNINLSYQDFHNQFTVNNTISPQKDGKGLLRRMKILFSDEFEKKISKFCGNGTKDKFTLVEKK